jgi:uncharacterized membrane protein YgcG
MKSPVAFATLVLCLAAAATVPALARTSYVVDDAHLLSQSAIAQINQQVETFQAQTGKEVVVVTTPSLDGATPTAAIERSFAQQQVNGVEIFIAKDEKVIRVAGDTASHQFFPSFQPIVDAMRPSFNQGDFDQGVETGVELVINTYEGHASSLRRSAPVSTTYTPVIQHRSSGGGFMGLIIWIVILAVIFFVIRGIFRAMAGPRSYGPGPGGPGYGPGGPGYGGPGYGGPGYGGYGGYGGGGFWSGLLGGLGGAWLGNEMFGGNRGTTIVEEPGNYAGNDPNYSGGDAGGWQSDPGQIDTSNIGGGGWGGDSGGGGGGWGGGGDFGGGGGGDSGGGGW